MMEKRCWKYFSEETSFDTKLKSQIISKNVKKKKKKKKLLLQEKEMN